VTPHATKILGCLDALNAALLAKGFPPMSDWWRERIRAFYRTDKRRFLLRVGRRGGKSSSLCRVAVVEALYGLHAIPPGDVGVVAIISARRPDALERLRTIKAILEAIGVAYDERGDSVELKSRRVVFTVFTASIAGVSGFTSIFVLCDEVAKWRDSDTGANPAAVVISSVAPTMATQPNAKLFLSSSPMGLLDAHADAFALGDTAHQMTAHAASWEANPTLTEEATRALEPDEVTWAREYAAIPQAEGETSHLTEALVAKNTLHAGDMRPDDRHTYVATIDPATRGNAWTLTIGCLTDNAVRRIVLTRQWLGTKKVPLVPGDVFREIALLLQPYRLKYLHSDQFSEDTLREIARQHGLALFVTPWTAGLKADAYDALKTLAQEGRLDLPDDPVVKTDLLGIRTKLTRNGIIFDLARQGPRHSDFAPGIAMNILLLRTPCVPVPRVLTEAQAAEAFKVDFLQSREKDRKRAERHGPLPITHTRLARSHRGH
jgi:hypothetical protein